METIEITCNRAEAEMLITLIPSDKIINVVDHELEALRTFTIDNSTGFYTPTTIFRMASHIGQMIDGYKRLHSTTPPQSTP